MTRTHNQQMGDAHERDIAEWIEGVQQKASGSQWQAQMDVINDERMPFALAADGKATLGKSISITRDMWQKAVGQTFNKIPTIWLRFYRDESLREVSTDLVVIECRDFLEMLEAARKWTAHQELAETIQSKRIELNMHLAEGDWVNGVPSLDTVREMAAEKERFPLLTVPVPEHPSGCDCCR